MGFVALAAVTFLPVVLAALAAFAILLFAIYHRTAADKICRVHALQLQHRMQRLMNDLIKLNRPAESLRRKREKAESDLSAAIASLNPAAIVTAKARLNAVILAQTALSEKQKSLLTTAALERKEAERRMRAEVGRFGLKDIRTAPGHAEGLAVRADPPSSLTPDYFEEAVFGDRQSEKFVYRQELFESLPDWLMHFLPGDLAHPMRDACAATLNTKEEQWKPVLKQASP